MSGHTSRQPRLTPAEQADLLPPTKIAATAASPPPPPAAPPGNSAAVDLLPLAIELPPEAALPAIEPPPVSPSRGSTEVTTAWSAQELAPPPASTAEPKSAAIPLLLPGVRNTEVRRLTGAERDQFRLWKNAILYGFFVGVLLLIFWLMARR